MAGEMGATMGDPLLAADATRDATAAVLAATVASQGVTIASHTSSIASLAPANGIQMPAAFYTTPLLVPRDASTATVLADDKTYFQYIGRINASKGSAIVCYYLKTSLVANIDPGTDWGEVSIWKGIPLSGAVPASLLRLGYTDCYTNPQFKASPGSLTVSVAWTSSNSPAGSDLWVGFGSKAGTNAQFEALTINRFAYPITLVADGQSSTLGTGGLLSAGMTVNSTVAAPAILVFLA